MYLPRRLRLPDGMTIVERQAETEWGLTAPLTADEEANLRAVAAVVPHWNRQDAAAVVAFYTPDIVWHNVAMGEVYTGRAQVQAFLEELFVALPDLRLDVIFGAPRGRYVAEEYVITGTHRGPMFGLPGTGRRVELHAVSMVQMREGRFAVDHFYFDAASAMRDMGYFPEAAMAHTRPGRIVLGLAAWFIRRRVR